MVTIKNKKKTLFTPEDLFRFRLCGKAVLSPDGNHIIVPVKQIDKDKNKYFTNLWKINTSTKEMFQFTFGDQNDTSPIWSPDGRSLVFISDRGKESQLWIIRTDGGEAQPLTKLERGFISCPIWSPNGSWIAFLFQKKGPIGAPPKDNKNKTKNNSIEPEYDKIDKDEMRRPKLIRRLVYKADGGGLLSEEHNHLWTVNPVTGDTRQLTTDDYDDLYPSWFPDSKSILFSSNRTDNAEYEPMRLDLWKIPLKGGKLKKIKSPLGPSIHATVSPDGSKIAYLGHDNPDLYWASSSMHLWLIDLNNGKTTNLTQSDDRTLTNYITSDLMFMDQLSLPQWSPDNNNIFYHATDQGACHLYCHNLITGKSQQMTQGPLEVRSYSFSKNCHKAALTVAELNHPGDIFLYSVGKSIKKQRVSNFNSDLLMTKKIAKPEEIWFENEETRLQGWLLKPNDFDAKKRYPLILEIHGGPHILFGYNLFFEFQYLVSQEYLVFYMNPRGSQGYGEEFTRSILKDWGGPDFRDLMKAIEELIKRPYVDQKRLGITGGSYGGFMTNWAIGHTDIFTAAVTQRSMSNIHSLFGTSDAIHAPQGVWGCFPWENRRLFDKLSPLSYIENIRTPLLIIHSELDYRCPIEQAEQLYASLKHLRRTVEFIRFPQEGHELSRSGAPDHRIERLKQIAGWFERFLVKLPKSHKKD